MSKNDDLRPLRRPQPLAAPGSSPLEDQVPVVPGHGITRRRDAPGNSITEIKTSKNGSYKIIQVQ